MVARQGLRASAQTRTRCRGRTSSNGYGYAMLRDGPIPRFVHGILEYLLGVLFIAAPFLFDFKSGAATGMSVAVGVLILIFAAASEGPVSLVNQLPVLLHVAMLYLLAIFLVAAPFLLGFSDEGAPRNFFMIGGVWLLLVTIGTRFRRSEPDAPARIDTGQPARSGRNDANADRSPHTPPSGSGPPPAGPLPPVPPHQSGGQPPRPMPPQSG